MLQTKIQGSKPSALLILILLVAGFILLPAGLFLAIGAIHGDISYPIFLVMGLIAVLAGEPVEAGDDGDKFLVTILAILATFIVLAIVAIFAGTKIGTSVARDKSVSHRQVGSVLSGLAGILTGFYVWNSIVHSPEPPIVMPVIVAAMLQIVSYFHANSLVYASKDEVRRKVWTPVTYAVMAAIPPAVLSIFANQQ